MTGQELIERAMTVAGVKASGQDLEATELSDGLNTLNGMLDSWSAERLAVFNIARTTYTISSSQSTRTFGSGGDWDAARPPRIEAMSAIISNIEYPIDYFRDEEKWQHIGLKNVNSGWPIACWDDDGFPLRTLSFWPTPTQTVTIAVYPWTALTSFSSLATDHTFPPGYEEALKYNLASRLVAEYPGLANQVALGKIEQLAAESKARIKAMNITPIALDCDPATRTSLTGGSNLGLVNTPAFNAGGWWYA